MFPRSLTFEKQFSFNLSAFFGSEVIWGVGPKASEEMISILYFGPPTII